MKMEVLVLLLGSVGEGRLVIFFVCRMWVYLWKVCIGTASKCRFGAWKCLFFKRSNRRVYRATMVVWDSFLGKNVQRYIVFCDDMFIL